MYDSCHQVIIVFECQIIANIFGLNCYILLETEILFTTCRPIYSQFFNRAVLCQHNPHCEHLVWRSCTLPDPEEHFFVPLIFSCSQNPKAASLFMGLKLNDQAGSVGTVHSKLKMTLLLQLDSRNVVESFTVRFVSQSCLCEYLQQVNTFTHSCAEQPTHILRTQEEHNSCDIRSKCVI